MEPLLPEILVSLRSKYCNPKAYAAEKRASYGLVVVQKYEPVNVAVWGRVANEYHAEKEPLFSTIWVFGPHFVETSKVVRCGKESEVESVLCGKKQVQGQWKDAIVYFDARGLDEKEEEVLLKRIKEWLKWFAMIIVLCGKNSKMRGEVQEEGPKDTMLCIWVRHGASQSTGKDPEKATPVGNVWPIHSKCQLRAIALRNDQWRLNSLIYRRLYGKKAIAKSICEYLWQMVAEGHDDVHVCTLLSKRIQQHTVREVASSGRTSSRGVVVKKLLPLSMRVKKYLDVGCAEGSLTAGIAGVLDVDAAHTHGCDVRDVPCAQGFVFRRIQGETLPYENGSFDLVTALMVLHHIPDPDQTIQEISRVLRPGGCFVLREHHLEYPELSMVLDQVHNFYSSVLSDPPEMDRNQFVETYEATYREKETWTTMAHRHGLQRLRSKERDDEYHPERVRHSSKNPQNYYWAVYQKSAVAGDAPEWKRTTSESTTTYFRDAWTRDATRPCDTLAVRGQDLALHSVRSYFESRYKVVDVQWREDGRRPRFVAVQMVDGKELLRAFDTEMRVRMPWRVDIAPSKRDLFFPGVPPRVRAQLLFDEEAVYSVTEAPLAALITELGMELTKEQDRRRQRRISCVMDGTACVGGNVAAFAEKYGNVLGIEYDPARCAMLRNNMNVLHPQHPRLVCACVDLVQLLRGACTPRDGDSASLERVQRSLQHVHLLFMDPPWGGPQYSQQQEVDLMLGATKVMDVCSLAFQACSHLELVLLKAPRNVRLSGYQGMAARVAHQRPGVVVRVFTLTFRKILLLAVLLRQPNPQESSKVAEDAEEASFQRLMGRVWEHSKRVERQKNGFKLKFSVEKPLAKECFPKKTAKREREGDQARHGKRGK